MRRIMAVIDIFIVFSASCIIAINGTARGNRVTGPLIRIEQKILRTERIPYKKEKNIVEFFRLKRHSNTERRIKKVIVFSNMLLAKAQEVIGVTMKSMMGNQAPAKA